MRAICAIMLGLSLVGTQGCAKLLPRSRSDATPTWESFDAAREAYDRIVPYRTTASEMSKFGYDPFSNQNIVILSYADILRRLIPANPVPSLTLDSGIIDCVSAQDQCRAYEIDAKNVRRKRLGNFWLDFLNFKRRTEVTGWRFNALVLLKHDLVVYKLWGGQPMIREIEENVNPLGPFQGAGEAGARGLIR
jgi:hypothetical protein